MIAGWLKIVVWISECPCCLKSNLFRTVPFPIVSLVALPLWPWGLLAALVWPGPRPSITGPQSLKHYGLSVKFVVLVLCWTLFLSRLASSIIGSCCLEAAGNPEGKSLPRPNHSRGLRLKLLVVSRLGVSCDLDQTRSNAIPVESGLRTLSNCDSRREALGMTKDNAAWGVRPQTRYCSDENLSVCFVRHRSPHNAVFQA